MHEFPVPAPVKIQTKLGAGSVDVIAEERDSAQVTVDPYDNSTAAAEAVANTRVELRGDVLAVEAPEGMGGWLFRRSPRLRVQIRVPQDSTAQVNVGSAAVTCHGRLADLVVNSASGAVAADRVTGDTSVQVASGAVRLGRIDGVLRVTGASGAVSVEQALGEVHVNVASGRVHIGEAGGDVRVSSASGGVEVGTARQGTVKINSASGGVTVGVAAGTGVWLDLNALSGTARNHLEMVGERGESEEHRLTLQVRTLSGDIEVRRAGVPV